MLDKAQWMADEIAKRGVEEVLSAVSLQELCRKKKFFSLLHTVICFEKKLFSFELSVFSVAERGALGGADIAAGRAAGCWRLSACGGGMKCW